MVAAPAAQATPGNGNSAATITASFADSCRDLAAHSSKDISHVKFHYADGRVVKDESISSSGGSDPDGDITSWSLDFGDGTSASGSWGTAPPTEVAHEYLPFVNCGGTFYVITLTVTDSAGQSESDVMLMVFLDVTPD